MHKLDTQMAELTDAARRASSIVNEHIDSLVELAERRADEIRRSAERDAEATRREAVESARRVFERINALERPLGELMHTLHAETERVERELGGHVEVEAIPSAHEDVRTVGGGAPAYLGTGPGAGEGARAPDETPPPGATGLGEQAPTRRQRRAQEAAEAQTAQAAERQAAEAAELQAAEATERQVAATHEREPEPTAGPREKPDAEPALEAADEGGAQQREAEPQRQPIPVGPAAVEPVPEQRKQGFFARLRGGGKKRSVFVTTPGHCAVCQKTFMAGSEENLRLSGWKVSDDVGLCPEDQADGWQLPEGARLPFRRGGG